MKIAWDEYDNQSESIEDKWMYEQLTCIRRVSYLTQVHKDDKIGT